MPEHSLFNWLVYSIWALGFGVTALYIRSALGNALGDRRLLRDSGRNGSSLIEANKAIRNEALRLAVAVLFTGLGFWALLVADSGAAPTIRGRVTLLAFLAFGALFCSQTWFDRADRNRQLTPPTP